MNLWNSWGRVANKVCTCIVPTKMKLKKLIDRLENKKSPGYDELSAKFLKLCAPYISDILAHILTPQYHKEYTLNY